jgi:glycogen synthase
VEAMSAGLVPVVFGAAGPAEVVEPDRSGVLVPDGDGFVSATAALVADPARRATLAAGARARAEEFGRPAFGRRLHALVDDLLAR